jgi:hypothetical protein
MSRPNNKRQHPIDIKVFIRNAQGHYLAEDAHGLFFTHDRSAAIVLNFQGDRVQEQLDTIQKMQGLRLTPDPVPPEEIYETCDRCKELFLPFMTHFDGKRFLCDECRKWVAEHRSGI